jgi:S-adenosylmethionine synthetase
MIEQTARDAIRAIGYDQDGFSHRTVTIDNRLHRQSADIAVGVDATDSKEEGAGDQGIMFGYACRETPEFMPAPIQLSHRIMQSLATARHSGAAPLLGPDAKAQVTLEYRDGKPVRATHIVVSTQHTEDAHQDDIRALVRAHVLQVLPEGWMCPEETFYVNPTGRFVIGGPVGDSGLTGRKIIVDTYGGACPHGGGAFSGKDPTKVDRSAAYAARYLAKNIVAAGYADTCTLQIAYAIGVAAPMALYVNTHGTGLVPEQVLADAIQKTMDLRPRGIREHLRLNRPIYTPTAAYGHFGRTPTDGGHFTWESLDLAPALQQVIG